MRFDRPSTTRRRLLTALAASTATTGCTGRLGGDRTGLPPFEAGWAAVRAYGTTDVRLAFDGDLSEHAPALDDDALFERAPFDVSLEPVDVEHAPDRPASHVIEGVVHDFVETQENWPGATWYLTGLLSLAADLPTVENPRVRVRFPSGYTYTLPTDHRRVDEGPVPVDRAGNTVLVNYGEPEEYPRSRTIPFVQHFDHEAFVWMRAYAEYRHRLLQRTIPLYRFETYEDEAADALRSGVADARSEFLHDASDVE